MNFFEPPPPPEEHDVSQPHWSGPPDNVVGVPVPIGLVIARTDDTAIAVEGMRAYPTGFEFEVTVRRRSDNDDDLMETFHGVLRRRARAGQQGKIPDEVFRFGVQFSYGRKATTLSGWSHGEGGEPPIVLMQRGGGSGERYAHQGFWVWPLPPEGPLTLACEWPAHGILFTAVEVDPAPIREAAGKAVLLWPDDRPVAPGPVHGATLFET